MRMEAMSWLLSTEVLFAGSLTANKHCRLASSSKTITLSVDELYLVCCGNYVLGEDVIAYTGIGSH